MAVKMVKFIKEKLAYLILAFMLLGLIYGYGRDVTYLKKLVTPVSFFMIYPMMINLNFTDFINSFKSSRLILIT